MQGSWRRMGAGVPPGLQNRCAVETRWAGSIPVRLRCDLLFRVVDLTVDGGRGARRLVRRDSRLCLLCPDKSSLVSSRVGVTSDLTSLFTADAPVLHYCDRRHYNPMAHRLHDHGLSETAQHAEISLVRDLQRRETESNKPNVGEIQQNHREEDATWCAGLNPGREPSVRGAPL